MKKFNFKGICILEGEFKGKWVYGDLLQKNGKMYITPHANSMTVDGHIGKMIAVHEIDPETVVLVDKDENPFTNAEQQAYEEIIKLAAGLRVDRSSPSGAKRNGGRIRSERG